ncbi:MAG: UDP-N-acetylmuramoyl-L-alanyl-D-glutamate--2,6-diaminopimelate ligase [Alphaproteobacteria bacterium]|nr:UDP-N-acetylmuramoyl-L-alanyl-D-glutamate--2,6-diaminopimelate ligase [Alphaproteobacteria bacterium]
MKLCQITNCSDDREICGLSADSREIKKGFLFGSLNGDQYIKSALDNGASAFIVPEDCSFNFPKHIAVIRTPNPNKEFAQTVARYYEYIPPHILMITGTNGKTSIADFVRQVLTMMGEKAASTGTLGIIKGNEDPIPSPNTTPNSVTIHRELRELYNEGFKYAIMEASSHGLCQYRLGGIRCHTAGFTNLTRDHLDYHKTFENYLDAKLILFRETLCENGTAVLNADIECFEKIRQTCLENGKKVITYGYNGKELRLLKTTPLPHGQKLDIEFYGRSIELEIPLSGEFQAMNVLCAIGILTEETGRPEEVLKHITKIHGAKGRLELVGQKNGAAIYIDYAHTPDALENVIRALRPHTTRHLHVLFGCGGDRDAGKRPIMGKLANELADFVYITDDNPRTENATEIRKQIMNACPKGIDIANRAEAIKTAINRLKTGDVLILAGKGHETGQYVNGKIYHFSDHEEVLKNI